MWIKSQDGLTFGNYNRFEIVDRVKEDGSVEWLITGGSSSQDYGYVLGAYSHKGYAVKILNIIIGLVNYRSDDIYFMPEDESYISKIKVGDVVESPYGQRHTVAYVTDTDLYFIEGQTTYRVENDSKEWKICSSEVISQLVSDEDSKSYMDRLEGE